jgi:hypothetical protein
MMRTKRFGRFFVGVSAPCAASALIADFSRTSARSFAGDAIFFALRSTPARLAVSSGGRAEKINTKTKARQMTLEKRTVTSPFEKHLERATYERSINGWKCRDNFTRVNLKASAE